jgi:FkbM family methyltransferase
LHDRKIFSKDYLRENSGACVIAGIIPWNEIHKEFTDNNYLNPFAISIHDIMLNWTQSDRQFKYSVEDMMGVYDSTDDYTSDIILLHDFIRKNYSTIIIPIETVLSNKHLRNTGTKPTGYWASDITKLDRFEKHTFVDGGAYIGDSLEQVMKNTSSLLSHAYCFELDGDNAEKLRGYVDKEGLNDRVTVFGMGLSDAEKETGIEKNSFAVGTMINYDSLDKTNKVINLDKVDLRVDGKLCIKLDVEGFELEALRGAIDTIRAYRPELAVCVYHKNDDVFEIPQMIKSILPEYKCILRGGWHMVCTASVEW